MNTSVDETNERLVFNDIKSNRHTASGVLQDENGNTFLIDVKGTNYEYVQRFIDYQLEKLGKGILTNVEPLTKKKKKAARGKDSTSKKAKVHTQRAWHGLSVTIQVKTLQQETDQPQKVHIKIDPDIEAGDSKQMNFTILGQDAANVKCEVASGKVTCELFEFTDTLRTQAKSRGKAEHVTGSKQFDVAQSKNIVNGKADWNFRVIGEQKSNFTLSLDLKVA